MGPSWGQSQPWEEERPRQGCGFVPVKKNKGGKGGKADLLGALPTAQLSGRASMKKMVRLSWSLWPLAAVATLTFFASRQKF